MSAEAIAIMADLREHLAAASHYNCNTVDIDGRDPDCAVCRALIKADTWLLANPIPCPERCPTFNHEPCAFTGKHEKHFAWIPGHGAHGWEAGK